MNKIKTLVLNHVVDFFIISGLIMLIYTTFLLNEIAGMYVLSAVLLMLGVYFSIPNRRR